MLVLYWYLVFFYFFFLFLRVYIWRLGCVLYVIKIMSDVIVVICIVDLKFCKFSIRLSCDSICDKFCKFWGCILCFFFESFFLIYGICGCNVK